MQPTAGLAVPGSKLNEQKAELVKETCQGDGNANEVLSKGKGDDLHSVWW